MRIANILTAVALAGTPSVALAQVENMGPKAATYITDEDVKKVNALPGVDRQIVSVDVGKLNEAHISSGILILALDPIAVDKEAGRAYQLPDRRLRPACRERSISASVHAASTSFNSSSMGESRSPKST